MVHNRTFECNIHILQGNKERIERIQITSVDNQDCPEITLLLRLDDTDYCGYAETTEDAVFEIIKQLPEKYKIKSCQSCRHGNFCPAGNYDNEIFCTKDFEVTQKSDLYFVTEDGNERRQRRRTLFDVCCDYQPITKNCYVYNDYAYLVGTD